MTAHWGIPDPAAVRGSEGDIERAFRAAFFLLDRRISLFLCLPFKALGSLALKRELDNIGQSTLPVAQDK
jgi:arsenate reductase